MKMGLKKLFACGRAHEESEGGNPTEAPELKQKNSLGFFNCLISPYHGLKSLGRKHTKIREQNKMSIVRDAEKENFQTISGDNLIWTDLGKAQENPDNVDEMLSDEHYKADFMALRTVAAEVVSHVLQKAILNYSKRYMDILFSYDSDTDVCEVSNTYDDITGLRNTGYLCNGNMINLQHSEHHLQERTDALIQEVMEAVINNDSL